MRLKWRPVELMPTKPTGGKQQEENRLVYIVKQSWFLCKIDFVWCSFFLYQQKTCISPISFDDDSGLCMPCLRHVGVYCCGICFILKSLTSFFLSESKKKEDNNKAWLWRSIFHIRWGGAVCRQCEFMSRSYISSFSVTVYLLLFFSFFFIAFCNVMNRTSFITFNRIDIFLLSQFLRPGDCWMPLKLIFSRNEREEETLIDFWSIVCLLWGYTLIEMKQRGKNGIVGYCLLCFVTVDWYDSFPQLANASPVFSLCLLLSFISQLLFFYRLYN